VLVDMVSPEEPVCQDDQEGREIKGSRPLSLQRIYTNIEAIPDHSVKQGCGETRDRKG